MDVRTAKQQCHLHCFIFWALADPPDIHCQLSQLSHMLLINELRIPLIRLVKYYSHHCLSCTNWTVNLCVDLVDWNWVALAHECVEHVLAELFTLDYHFLWFWVNFWVENSQCVDSVCFFCDSRCNWSWIKPVKAGSSHDRDLRSSRDKDLDSIAIEFAQNLSFQERWLTETTDHKNEINLLIFLFNLLQKLFNLVLDIFEQSLEEGNHHGSWNLNIGGSLNFQVVLLGMVFIESFDKDFEFFGIEMFRKIWKLNNGAFLFCPFEFSYLEKMYFLMISKSLRMSSLANAFSL